MRTLVIMLMVASTAAAESPWAGEPWEALSKAEKRARWTKIRRWQIENADPQTKLDPFMSSFLRGAPSRKDMRDHAARHHAWEQSRPMGGTAGGFIDEQGHFHTLDRAGKQVVIKPPQRRPTRAQPYTLVERHQLRLYRAAVARGNKHAADRRPDSGLLADAAKGLEIRRQRSIVDQKGKSFPDFVHRQFDVAGIRLTVDP